LNKTLARLQLSAKLYVVTSVTYGIFVQLVGASCSQYSIGYRGVAAIVLEHPSYIQNCTHNRKYRSAALSTAGIPIVHLQCLDDFRKQTSL